jgi:glucose-1-phosphate adenylyltransferase
LAATMIGGRYRLIDFALSNMVNSGVKTIGIVIPEKFRSILDHLGAGKPWNLDRKNGGIFILPGTEFGLFNKENKFAVADLQTNVEILERTAAEYMVVSSCNQVMNVSYTPMLDKMDENQADICLIYKNVKEIPADEEPGWILKIDPDGKVRALVRQEPFSGKELKPLFMDAFVVKRTLLQEMVDGYAGHGSLDVRQIIHNNIQKLNVQAYEHKGYLRRVSSVQSYYRCNMDMLNQEIRNELFMGENKIFTKTKDNPPTRYGTWGSAEDALISGGCTVNGQVERSVLFRGVQVETGAVIKNSVIMSDSFIGKDSILENVILDKYTFIDDRSVMKGKPEAPLLILDKRKKLIHREKGWG